MKGGLLRLRPKMQIRIMNSIYIIVRLRGVGSDKELLVHILFNEVISEAQQMIAELVWESYKTKLTINLITLINSWVQYWSMSDLILWYVLGFYLWLKDHWSLLRIWKTIYSLCMHTQLSTIEHQAIRLISFAKASPQHQKEVTYSTKYFLELLVTVEKSLTMI